MSTKSNDNDDSTDIYNPDSDDEAGWHALVTCIGQAIAEDRDHNWSGGYHVSREADDTIILYREIDKAGSADALEVEGDRIHESADYAAALVEIGRIEPPEGGWAPEVHGVRKSIWEGYR